MPLSFFRKSSTTAVISEPDKDIFSGRWLGKVDTYIKDDTTAAVQKIWEGAPAVKHMRKVVLTVTDAGLSVQEKGHSNSELERFFKISLISFCKAELKFIPNIFSWITRVEERQRFECCAVFFHEDTDKPQQLTASLKRRFTSIYNDMRLETSRRKTAACNERRKLSMAVDFNVKVQPKNQRRICSSSLSGNQSVSCNGSTSSVSSSPSPDLNDDLRDIENNFKNALCTLQEEQPELDTKSQVQLNTEDENMRNRWQCQSDKIPFPVPMSFQEIVHF